MSSTVFNVKFLKQLLNFIVGLIYTVFLLVFTSFAQSMDLTGPPTSNSMKHLPTLFTHSVTIIIG